MKNYYYKITCKMGHQGTGKYGDITFYICSTDTASAVEAAKAMPGVKHDRLPQSVEQITRKEFLNGRKTSAYERYKK